MNAPTPTDHLRRASLHVRNADPRAWDEFLTAFERYTDKAVYDILRADQSTILGAQAAAQQCAVLRDLFNECDNQSASP